MSTLDTFLKDALNQGKTNLVEEIIRSVKNQDLVTMVYHHAFSLGNKKITKAAFESGYLNESAVRTHICIEHSNLNADLLLELYPKYTNAIEDIFRFAIFDNELQLVKTIIKHAKNNNKLLSPTSQWTTVYTQLDVNMINVLMDGVNDKVINPVVGDLLMCNAVLHDNPVVLEALILKGIELSKALEYATIFGSIDSIRILIEHNVTVTDANLDLCRSCSQPYCVELLEDKLEQQYIEKEQELFTRFCWGIIESDTKLCISCIEDGLTPFYTVKDETIGTVSLMSYAIANFDRELVSYLRTKGVNPLSTEEIVNLFDEGDNETFSEPKAAMIIYLLDIGALDLSTVDGDVVHEYRKTMRLITERRAACIEELKKSVKKVHNDLKISIQIKAYPEQLEGLKQLLEELDQACTYIIEK